MKQQQQEQQQQQTEKDRDKKIYKVITGNAIVDFFGCIRDSAIMKSMRIFIFDYLIVNKAAFMIVYNITLCSLLTYRSCILTAAWTDSF